MWLLDCSHKEGERKVHSFHFCFWILLVKETSYGYWTALTRKESVRYIALILLLFSAG